MTYYRNVERDVTGGDYTKVSSHAQQSLPILLHLATRYLCVCLSCLLACPTLLASRGICNVHSVISLPFSFSCDIVKAIPTLLLSVLRIAPKPASRRAV